MHGLHLSDQCNWPVATSHSQSPISAEAWATKRRRRRSSSCSFSLAVLSCWLMRRQLLRPRLRYIHRLHIAQNARHGQRKGDGRCYRGRRGDYFHVGRYPIRRHPQGYYFHEMGGAAGDDEGTERQEHPVKGNGSLAGAHQVHQGQRDHDVGNADEQVRHHVGGDQGSVAQIAKGVRHELHADQAAAQKRPQQSSQGQQRQSQREIANLIRLASGDGPDSISGSGGSSEDISETPLAKAAQRATTSDDCTRFRAFASRVPAVDRKSRTLPGSAIGRAKLLRPSFGVGIKRHKVERRRNELARK